MSGSKVDPSGKLIPGDARGRMRCYMDRGQTVALLASTKPTNQADTVSSLQFLPGTSTLILTGTHGDSWQGLDSFTDAVILGNKAWSQADHADGQRFYLEDLEALKQFFPDVTRDSARRGSDDDRMGPGGSTGGFAQAKGGYIRKLEHFYTTHMGKGFAAAKQAARGIADFCKEKRIEKIVVAFCFGAQNPVVHELAKELGIAMTILS